MLSIAQISCSAESAAKYYCEDKKLASEDYYLKGEDPPGQWYGGESLGLSGEVIAEDFASLLKGEDPRDKKMLVHAGGREKKHHPGWDMTFSAPKSVSIAYARSNEDMRVKILDAHNRAVRVAMDYLKEDILTAATRRVRKENGIRTEYREQPKDIIAACFNHQTSRELDPQLHTHAVVLNVAQRQDNSWGTLKVKQAFSAKKAVGAAYRAELSHTLQKELGIAVEKDREFFRVSAVPKELESDFSKRRRQILNEMNKKGLSGGVHAAKATLTTRANKHAFDHGVLEEAWRKEMNKDGFTAQKFVEKNIAAVKENKIHMDKNRDKDQMDLISDSIREITHHDSTFTREKVAQKSFEQGQCNMSVREVRQELDKLENHNEIVGLKRADFKKLYTSKEMIATEAKMLSNAVSLSKEKGRIIDQERAKEQIKSYEKEKSRELGFDAKLTPDQEKAVSYALGSEQVAIIAGVAGAGKSFAMGAVKHVYEKSGFNVRGFAPTGIASQNLAESGIESMTLDKFFRNPTDNLTKNDVVICDEMGMVGSRKTARLLEEVKKSGAKLIMVGESEQLQPVESGGSFRAISHVIEKESISKIFRQKESWQRDAVEFFRAGDSKEALELYDRHGALRVAESEPSLKKDIVNEYLSYRDENPKKRQVVLSRNNADVADINQKIRETLQENGHIGAKNYRAIIENRLGRVEKDFSSGDKVIFLKNDTKLGVKNGNLAEVTKVIPDAKGGARFLLVKIGDKDLKVDLFRYDKIDHSYAITIHKSQASTFDRVLVHGNLNMDRESTYVANSRQKESVLLFCSLAQFGKDLSMNYEPLFRSKEEVIKESLKPELTKTFDRSGQKDTSLDYTVLEPLATRQLKGLGEQLKPVASREQLEVLSRIATTQGAAKSLLGDPSPAPWLENAREILKTGSYNKVNDLKTYIESLKTGYDPTETSRFNMRKSDLEKSVAPYVASQLEQINSLEKSKENQQEVAKEQQQEKDRGMEL